MVESHTGSWPFSWELSLAYTLHWPQHVGGQGFSEWDGNVNLPEGILSGKGLGKEG